MALANDFAQSLKLQADIVRVVGDYVSLKKAGAQNYSGLCPFHKEKSGSFSVHAVRQFYHCFGCQASGDVFSFVGKIENIGFPEAVRVVAQKCGIPQQIHDQLAAGHKNTEKLLKQVCGIAQQQAQQPRGPAGPSLSEALGSAAVLPEATKTKRGGSTFDTLSGNVLTR